MNSAHQLSFSELTHNCTGKNCVQEHFMKVTGINQEVIDLLLSIGADSHPNEFAALLIEENGIIQEVNLIPGTVGGKHSACMFIDMMPLTTHLAGSAHSHPNGVIRPSDADVSFFGKTGQCHLIIGYPYESGCWKCFSAAGKQITLEVV